MCNFSPCRCPREAPPCVPPPPPFDDFQQCPRGYQVGDILTLVGGTFTTQATLTVLTINVETGSVLTVNVSFAGSYAAFPANPVATTGGGGTGATFNITGTAGTSVTAVAVQAGGGPWPRGYRVGDVLQLDGGTYTAPASVVVTGTNVGGQVTGIARRTAGSGYSVNPCEPAPTIGGHGCGAKIQWTIVGGIMTIAVLADGGGPCHEPRRQWWERTSVNIFPPGSGPPALPRSTALGLLNPPGTEFMRTLQASLVNTCNVVGVPITYGRPLSYLWLPAGTDVNATCCLHDGDVVEVPAKSGRLYNVWWTEYIGLDLPGTVPGPPAQPWPCTGEFLGGKLLVAMVQQCPFGASGMPTGNWLTDDSGASVLYGDLWHWLEPV